MRDPARVPAPALISDPALISIISFHSSSFQGHALTDTILALNKSGHAQGIRLRS
jgi:hypothetical protein